MDQMTESASAVPDMSLDRLAVSLSVVAVWDMSPDVEQHSSAVVAA